MGTARKHGKTTTMTNPGKLIAFEGPDFTGKTDQAIRLSKNLDALAIPHTLTSEPTRSPLGDAVRHLCLHTPGILNETKLLLFMADRAEHYAKVIEPALEQGHVVICDRSPYSTLAYQGYAQGLNIKAINAVQQHFVTEREPDLVILLDAEPYLLSNRVKAQDLVEADERVQQRVWEYYNFAYDFSLNWVKIDALQSRENIEREALVHTRSTINR